MTDDERRNEELTKAFFAVAAAQGTLHGRRRKSKRSAAQSPLPPSLGDRIKTALGKRPAGTGWANIPGGSKGGFRKRGSSGDWIYWYPGMDKHGGSKGAADAHLAGQAEAEKAKAKKKAQKQHDKHMAAGRRAGKRAHQARIRGQWDTDGSDRGAYYAKKEREHFAAAAQLRREHGLGEPSASAYKSEQPGELRKGQPKPPAGFEPVPHGAKGGFRKRAQGGGYTYWYPGSAGKGQSAHALEHHDAMHGYHKTRGENAAALAHAEAADHHDYHLYQQGMGSSYASEAEYIAQEASIRADKESAKLKSTKGAQVVGHTDSGKPIHRSHNNDHNWHEHPTDPKLIRRMTTNLERERGAGRFKHAPHPEGRASWARKSESTEENMNLRKGDARGGKYVRRIPKPGGGYTYVYDEQKKGSRRPGFQPHEKAIGHTDSGKPIYASSRMKHHKKHEDRHEAIYDASYSEEHAAASAAHRDAHRSFEMMQRYQKEAKENRAKAAAAHAAGDKEAAKTHTTNAGYSDSNAETWRGRAERRTKKADEASERANTSTIRIEEDEWSGVSNTLTAAGKIRDIDKKHGVEHTGDILARSESAGGPRRGRRAELIKSAPDGYSSDLGTLPMGLRPLPNGELLKAAEMAECCERPTQGTFSDEEIERVFSQVQSANNPGHDGDDDQDETDPMAEYWKMREGRPPSVARGVPGFQYRQPQRITVIPGLLPVEAPDNRGRK